MDSDKVTRLKAMRWQRPEYIPVSVSILGAAWIKYRDDLEAIVDRHPVLFGVQSGERNYDEVYGTYAAGRHVDAWGCVWDNVHSGNEAIVTVHPVPTREDVRTLEAPREDTGFPHGFMYLRLCDLRGFEEMMVDFAEEPEELQMLIDTVCDYNVRQAEKLAAELVQGDDTQIVYFGDDLGMQHALPISPEKWRKYMKLCYRKIYKPILDTGAAIFMHTDGHIVEIIPDLIDVGVSVVNPQVRANGIDNLATVCKGKVCVSLDLDRQMFPFASPKEIDDHIREVVEKLGAPEGGLWLVAEINDDVPLENIEGICSSLERYRLHYS